MHLFKVNTAQSENAWWAVAASVIASVSAACGLTAINVTVNNTLPQDIINTFLLHDDFANDCQQIRTSQQLKCYVYS